MPKVSKESATDIRDFGLAEDRTEEFGGYTVNFVTIRQDHDLAPFLKGLPGDRCQCPHWGVVLTGQIVFRYTDRDEVFKAGDAYYGGPGHLPLMFAGTELIEFSPTESLNETMAIIEKNMAAAGPDAQEA